MRDDAVAPVIAVMLILAAAVTVFAVFNGIYIPSLKQSAEIDHLHNVEAAFMKFSSDIMFAASSRQDDLSFNEPVQLGGGDVVFNAIRSGGTLSVRDESLPVYFLVLDDETGEDVIIDGTLVNISYGSVGNFWQDQGYRWQNGYLNVTKYGIKQGPLNFDNMTDVNNEFEGAGSLASFAGSFGDVQYTLNQTLFPDMDINGTITSYSSRADNCSSVNLRAVNLTASLDHSFASGNGFGTLELKSSVISVPYYGVSTITIGSGREPFGNATFRKWNSSLTTLDGACTNIDYNTDPDYSGDGFSTFTVIQEVSPVNVTVNIVNIEIGAN